MAAHNPTDEVALIARDIETIGDDDIEAGLVRCCSSQMSEAELVAYATLFLHRARNFVQAVASEECGFTYIIG